MHCPHALHDSAAPRAARDVPRMRLAAPVQVRISCRSDPGVVTRSLTMGWSDEHAVKVAGFPDAVREAHDRSSRHR